MSVSAIRLALCTVLLYALGASAGISHHARYDHSSHPHPHNLQNPYRRLLQRSITTDIDQASGKSYDFIIAGGGVAGLALAARLSEWSNVTVLLVEAGLDGSAYEDNINIPGYSYLHGLSGTAYDWNYTTTTQTSAASKTKSWPRGRGLGGSGATNGLFWCRGSSTEYDAWATLNPSGNQTWNWDEVNKYIMKSEGYTDASSSVKSEFSMVTDTSAHGTDGPIQIGFSAYIWDAVSNWLPTWSNMGFSVKDLAAGDLIPGGAMMCPSTIRVTNGTRSDSKAGYIDPLAPRPNLVILTGQQVTSVTFNGSTDASGNKLASGVTFQAYKGATQYSAQANKEVILSGGTIGSAQILQLSGVGPSTNLTNLGIDVVLDLPVGYNLQDHYSSSIYFTTSATTWASLQSNSTLQAEQLTQWREDGTGMWTYVNEAIGYTAMSDLLSSSALSTYTSSVSSNLSTVASAVVAAHGLPDTVATGLASQYSIMSDWLSDDTVGQLEILLTMLGKDGATNQMGIQVALQHPWSRGTIMISSTDPFTAPNINPDYFGVNYDADIMNYGTVWSRKLAGTSPLSNVMTTEAAPGTSTTGDSLTTYFKENGGTEYHPLGTCSMLPKDSGGVVDTNLIVYGSANLRVVDSSIMPLQLSAHLMATTYGIAEKAADIIKEYHWAYVADTSSASTSATAATTATAGQATDSSVTSSNDKSTATDTSSLSSGAKIGIGIGAGVGALAVIAALLALCLRRRKNTRAAPDSKGTYAPPVQQDAYANTPAAKEIPENEYPMAAFTAPLAPYSHSRSDSMDSMDTTNMASRTPMRSDSGYGLAAAGSMPYRDQSSYSLDSHGYHSSQAHSRAQSPPQGGAEYPRHQTYTPVKF